MTRILLERCNVITLEQADEVLLDVAVAIEGDRIVQVGQLELPQDWTPDEVFDLAGCVVMPGLWNTHTHAAMAQVRSIGDDLPLDRWFNEKIWVAESGLTEEDVYWGTMLAAAEMIKSGTVGFADHYFHMHQVAEVVERSGLKALLATAVFGAGQEVGRAFEESLAWAKVNQNAADGRVRTTLGPHSPYICPPDFLREVAQIAAREGLGIHLHLAESDEQVNNSLKAHGKTPVAFVESLGLFDVPMLAAHCLFVNEDDLDILAAHHVTVVQCPQCHMKLGMGITRVSEMLQRGISVALGTDGVGSNNNLDMFKEARLASLLQKLAHKDATRLAGDLPLRLAATHGARACGFPESGTIRPGASADLIVVDTRQPHLQPQHSLIGNVLFSASGGDVVHSMVAGCWLMRDRKLLTLDEEEITAQAHERAAKMVRRGTSRVQTYRG